MRGKELTPDFRRLIVDLHDRSGKSYREIAEELGLSKGTVASTIQRWKMEGLLVSKPRSGRPLLTDSRGKFCRACLGILDNSSVTHSLKVPSIRDLFQNCTSLKVNPKDTGLPRLICDNCYIRCGQWSAFRAMCWDAETHLKGAGKNQQQSANENEEEPFEMDYEEHSNAETPEFSIVKVESLFNAEQDDDYEVLDPLVTETFEQEENSDSDSLELPSTSVSEKSSTERSTKGMPYVTLPADYVECFTNWINLGQQPKTCRVCNTSVASLALHTILCHSNGQMKCPECHTGQYSDASFLDHLVCHYKEQWYRCALCSVTRNAHGSLMSHLKSVHPDLEHDMDNKVRLSCSLCPMKFGIRLKYEVHMRNHGTVALNTNSSRFCCPTCRMVFGRKEVMKAHASNHEDRVENIQCLFCASLLKDHEKLKSHLLKFHPEEAMEWFEQQEDPLSCPDCTEVFPNMFELKKHLLLQHSKRFHRTHSPQTCSECGKEFYSTITLRKHVIREHVGERNLKFVCEVCGKRFFCNSALEQHRRFHGSERLSAAQRSSRTAAKYVCNVCQKEFNYKHRIRFTNHLKKMHNITNVELSEYLTQE